MSTIPAGAGLSIIARILHAAAAMGPGTWDGGGGGGGGGAGSSGPPEPTLSNDLLALFTLLHNRGLAYLLVGGVALLRYVQGRNTEDIDLIVEPAALNKLPELVVADRNPHFARAKFGSLRVDLLLASNPVFRLASKNFATTHRFSELDVRCATVEGLVLLKLYALPALYREGDLQRAALYETDLTMLMQKYHPELEPLMDTLRAHLQPGEMAELERIAAEIGQRLARMDQMRGK